MLASDLNNPEFQGAIANPDSRLSVVFYNRPVQNNFKTEKEGRPIFEDVSFVRITLPGDSNNIIDTPVRDEHKQRFPIQWARFENSRAGDGQMIGTPLSAWPLITAAQAEELKALKFMTVEQVAGAADSQLQRLGMVAGMSPYAFRERAQRYLKIAKEEADTHQSEARIKELEEEVARMKEQASGDEVAKPRAKPGPKPKAQPEGDGSEQ